MSGTPVSRSPVLRLALAAALLLAGSLRADSPRTDRVKWRSIATGEAEARKSGKPVLYFFTADWCGPCHVLKDQVFAETRAADRIHRDFVPVVLADQSRETGQNENEMLRLARKFEIQGFPTLVVARPDGKKAVRLAGWAGRERTLDWLGHAPGRLVEMETGASAAEGGRP